MKKLNIWCVYIIKVLKKHIMSSMQFPQCPPAPKKQKLSLRDDGIKPDIRQPDIRQPDFTDDKIPSVGSDGVSTFIHYYILSPSMRSDATPPQTPPQSPRQFECPGAPRAHRDPIPTWASVINTE